MTAARALDVHQIAEAKVGNSRVVESGSSKAGRCRLMEEATLRG
jgi:hypothetical protein